MKAALARKNGLGQDRLGHNWPGHGWPGQLWPVVLIITAAVVLISAPVYTYRIMNPTDNDYGTHIQFALDLIRGQPVPLYTLAHPVIQVLLIGILWITRGKVGLWVGLILVQVIAQVLTALILYFWFGQLLGQGWDARRAFWAVTLTIVAPVMALLPVDGNYYFGYIGLASYHNPTIHLLRPFALVSFILAVRSLEAPRSPLWMVFASALMIAFSALIKPNYALCVLPALALLAVARLLRKIPVDWRMVLGGFVVPACLVLAVQGIVTYSDGGSIIFQPFTVEAGYSGYLPVKFLLSIIFPLCAAIIYAPKIARQPEMLLAWAAFAAGVLQLYLLAESGGRLEHGNFRWGAQIGLFLLFAATARLHLKSTARIGKERFKQCLFVGIAYLPHVIAGVVYYVHVITSKGYG
jgi:hypothetical protein